MPVAKIAIIDSGGANIASLKYALQRLGHVATLTTEASAIQNATRVILPGVGAAKDAMQRLREHQLLDVIRKLTQPVLGICLGMQLLADASEEENVDCLGIIPGLAGKLPQSPGCPVPNMGWCSIRKTKNHRVLNGLDNGEYFYFLHSYALPVAAHTLASAEHADDFSAVVAKGNFIAAQFHPERSSAAGSRLLGNFLEWTI